MQKGRQIKSHDFKKASNQIKSRAKSNKNAQKSIQIKSNHDLIFAHPWVQRFAVVYRVRNLQQCETFSNAKI